MHPRMMSFVREHHEHSGGCGCGPSAAFVPWSRHHRHLSDPGGPPFGGGPFGVRRPLRFLAWKLGLREEQVAELAGILNELKTERAQHEVDDRRALSLLADAVAGETFDAARAEEASRLRVESAQRLQTQVAKALGRIHALLDAEQRGRIAYLMRSGALAM
ncbi:MAG: periplasmic heavy metal sensor [Candidatus Eisenbacteria bacterium]